MSIFKKKRSLNINERDPTYKVKYLGNVQTAMMKGDGCVDKPIAVIWNNYLRNPNPGLAMKLTITSSGLKAFTEEQGLTEYRAHRISYCIAHPNYPKLFVWVYRHEGKRMKMELRCHAVLCKSESKAKAMALQLHDKISLALKEFMREKTRRQNARLTLQRTNSLPVNGSVLPKRTQLLSTGGNFKLPICKSNTAPKLGAIHEGDEQAYEDLMLQEQEEEDEDTESSEEQEINGNITSKTDVNHAMDSVNALNLLSDHVTAEVDALAGRVIDIEIGNDIDELKRDGDVQYCLASNGDSDGESSESGFHEQDLKDGSLTSSEDTATLDVDEAVCDVPSGDDNVSEENEVTSL